MSTLKALKKKIKFCKKCGEYLVRRGECSNPGCPSPIKDIEEKVVDNKTLIEQEVKDYGNQIVLYSGELYRLIGYADGKEDYYYITKDMRGRRSWQSCVGGIVPLKKYLPEKDYEHLDNLFELNDFFSNKG